MKIEALQQAVSAPDRLDWRVVYNDDLDEWEAWFHPDWKANPIRVLLTNEGDVNMSDNERACVAALQAIVAHAPALVAVAAAVQAYTAGPSAEGYERLCNELDALVAVESEAAQ